MTRSGNGDRRLIRRPGWLLAAGAALAICVAAVGIRAAAGAALRDSGLATGGAVGLALLFMIGALVAGAKYRTHVRMNDVRATATDRLRQATIAILFASAVLLPIALSLLRRPSTGNGSADDSQPPIKFTPTALPTRSFEPRSGRSGHFSFDLTAFLIALMIAIGALVLAALIVLAVRLARKVPTAGPTAALAPTSASSAADEALADALLAGRSALEGDDARAAIIACYAAMEQSLSRAGIARERADSPSDLLHRATRQELPGAGARDAAALTDLFREARFSTHPMTKQHLAAARGALDSVTAALAERIRAREAEAEAAKAKARAVAGAGTGAGAS